VAKSADLRPELIGLWFATLSGGPVKPAVTGYGRSLELAINDVLELYETGPRRRTGGKRRSPMSDRVKHIRQLGRGL
jgi:hypothetical protein